MEYKSSECPHLAALVAQERAEMNATQLADAIEQHLIACVACAVCEQGLTRLITEYRHIEPSLNEDVEHRLLDQLCRERPE